MVAIAHHPTRRSTHWSGAPARRTTRRADLRLVPPLELQPARNAAHLAEHTYRRRRLVALVALVAVVAIAAVGARSVVGGASKGEVRTQPGVGLVVADLAAYGAAGEAPPRGSRYVVQPGDTLWSIAGALHPSGDVRKAVDRLVELNGSAALSPGQRILVE